MLDKPCSEVECKTTGYPLHSHVSPSLPLPCVTVCHQVSTEPYIFVIRQVGIQFGAQCCLLCQYMKVTFPCFLTIKTRTGDVIKGEKFQAEVAGVCLDRFHITKHFRLSRYSVFYEVRVVGIIQVMRTSVWVGVCVSFPFIYNIVKNMVTSNN